MKKLIAVTAAIGLLLTLGGVASASKPAVVWEDAAGDAGNQNSGVPGFDYAGFDIVSGSIARNKKNLEFTVNHSQMLPSGSLPEAFRFLWGFNVDGSDYRFTVKRADIGKPDVSQGQTSERVGRVDVNGHFRLEGDCGTTNMGIDFINCKPLAYLEGVWDPGTKSFTVTVPMKLVKAKPGSKIQAAGGDAAQICAIGGGSICWVTHYAERSLNYTVIDSAAQAKPYKVPKK